MFQRASGEPNLLQLVVQNQDYVDGVKPDGSFHQHIGMIYNGKMNAHAFSYQSNRTDA
jgi:hypothetical protein